MDELRLASLLCTRLCHDLVGPVGAVNNGVELLSDPSAGMEDEVIALLRHSAGESARRLRFFRVAFGLPGKGDGGVDDARAVARALFEEGKVSLDWPDGTPPPSASTHAGFAQLLLNMILCAAEGLPRGGSVAVRSSADAGGLTVRVAASGPGARLSEALRAALGGVGDVASVDARSVQPYLTARLAAAVGAALDLAAPSPDTAELTATLAGGS